MYPEDEFVFVYQDGPTPQRLRTQLIRAMEKHKELLRSSSKKRAQYWTVRRQFGLICLVLGILLLILGLWQSDDRSLVVAGVIGFLAGLVGFFCFYIAKPEESLSAQAKKAADDLIATFIGRPYVTVRFTTDGIIRKKKAEPIPYAKLDVIVETEDLYLLTWGSQIMVLQKEHLEGGTQEEFTAFLAEETGLPILSGMGNVVRAASQVNH